MDPSPHPLPQGEGEKKFTALAGAASRGQGHRFCYRAGAPLALDTANFADPGADALTWERVVKKLGVGAMPPQGSPTPGAAELARFRASLITNLDRAAAQKKQPGQFVVHRLNRTEYANAVRDLLDVKIDETDLLPSDGGDFGFDNVASALKTSPLLLDRYVAAGLQVAGLAVGDATAEPGTATYTISTVVTQDQHVEGLPLGTRGGILVNHTFPADGEYVFSGRLLKTVAEGLSGVEGHETPHLFIVTVDGTRVFSSPIGGKADHDAAEENKPVAGLTPQAAQLIERFSWLGNVRQLENTIFRAVVLCDGAALDVCDFPQIAAAMGVETLSRQNTYAPAAGGVMEAAAPFSEHQLLAIFAAEIAAVADIGAGWRERSAVAGLIVRLRPRCTVRRLLERVL